MNIGVHKTHCCSTHGCKYEDKNCPVVSGSIQQDYPCEECTVDKTDEFFLYHESFMVNLCAVLGLEYENTDEEIILAKVKELKNNSPEWNGL